MICVEKKYFSLNRIVLLILGLWPYQQSKFARLRMVLLISIVITSIGFQLTAFMTAECTPGFVIKVLSSVLFFSIFVIKYNAFWINIKSVKYSLEQLQHICNQLKDDNEISIIERYGRNAKCYTMKLVVFGTCCLFTLFSMPIWQRFLGASSRQESGPRRTLQIVTEYFVNEEKYFYLILLHVDIALCIGIITLIGTGTMIIVYLKHVCGMFRIASYRIEQAMVVEVLKTISLKEKIMIYKQIISAVDIHRKAMEFSQFLVYSFEGSFFIFVIFGVICLSLNLFRIFQIVSLTHNIEELMVHLAYIIAVLLYMFLGNRMGQEITDHNNHVFLTVYNVRWYIAPIHIQKMILFLLQRGNKTFSLNIGGLFVASIECFAALSSASISYFTVIYSTQ